MAGGVRGACHGSPEVHREAGRPGKGGEAEAKAEEGAPQGSGGSRRGVGVSIPLSFPLFCLFHLVAVRKCRHARMPHAFMCAFMCAFIHSLAHSFNLMTISPNQITDSILHASLARSQGERWAGAERGLPGGEARRVAAGAVRGARPAAAARDAPLGGCQEQQPERLDHHQRPASGVHGLCGPPQVRPCHAPRAGTGHKSGGDANDPRGMCVCVCVCA